ncbi:TIGR01777 family oxidoreductase [Neptunicella sp.]|uniref:TIGR01777 family oxidoreductase n=1 Tax=Neptunicella sp. TaxID=2125986 RepID=UPI003F6920D9
MHILITGGTGLIGRQFIRAYPHYQYTVLTRQASKWQASSDGKTHYIDDLNSVGQLNDIDAVINLAGEPIADKRWTEQQKQRICESRWQITRQLVTLIRASDAPPKIFLSGSAIGFYGDTDGKVVTEKDSASQPDFASDLCSEWENIANSVAELTRTVTMRTGVVLSTQGGALKKMLLPFKLGLGGRIGNGKQYMSWIHIDDMVKAIDFLLTHNEISGAINMTSPNAVSNIEFTRSLATCLNKPAFLPVPASVLKLLMGESSSLLLGSQQVYPQKLLDNGFSFKQAELTQALDSLLNTPSG